MLRFAPSPTGDMPIGDLRIALLNYLVARQREEPFLIRIDDTQKARNIEGKDTEIMQILEKFAIKHDQVYHQSEHLRMHQTLALRLLEEKKAFVCTCIPEAEEEESEATLSHRCSGTCKSMTQERLANLKREKKPFVIRIEKPETAIEAEDLVMGKIIADPEEVGEIVILHTDSTPTEDFASACDDMLSDITLIIRSDTYRSRTPGQIHIKRQLGYDTLTRYAHLPAILDEREEAVCRISVKQLFEEGFIPDAIINYLLLLGYAHPPQEIFTFPEALAWFDLEAITDTSPIFEIETLRAINREHLKRMDDRRLSTVFAFADADIGRLAKVYLDEACTVNELDAKIRPIFAPKPFEGAHTALMRQIQQILVDAPMFETFDELEAYVVRESGTESEKLAIPLRLLLTGTDKGPDLRDIYPCIRSYLLEVIS